MTIDIDATYRDGALYPETPLNLPENTPVRVRLEPKPTAAVPAPFPKTREEILAIRPKSPRFTGEQLDALLKKYSVSVGSLPADLSREDIYSDHD